MPKSLMVIFSDPTGPDEEAEYNRWYSDKHLRDVVGVPGIVSATRYRLDKGVRMADGAMPPNGAGYMALYELEAETTEELQAISDALAAAIGEGKVDVSPSLDAARIEASFAVPITDKVV